MRRWRRTVSATEERKEIASTAGRVTGGEGDSGGRGHVTCRNEKRRGVCCRVSHRRRRRRPGGVSAAEELTGA